ncbi:MAG: hypothetical protein GYA33_05900 [Thermogutta sp.]|nr:hypothetical protein [Thermogutta sp.]
MRLSHFRIAAGVLALSLISAGWSGFAAAQAPCPDCPPGGIRPGAVDNHRVGDLFPSYWAPMAPGNLSAPLYVAPIPTPPYVGHTWVTYQPLYPHEFLHKHMKVYRRQNAQGGRTRTVVGWY